MKLRFIFHKPKGELRLWPLRCVGALIVGWTWFLALFHSKGKALKYNFSHVELLIPEVHRGKEGQIIAYAWWKGECFSSTTRGGAKGVRFAPASEVLKHPERWEYIEVEVDDERFEVAIEEARRLVGNGYDYGYIISFLQPFIVQKKEDWACSEICDWFAFLNHIPTERNKWAKKPLPVNWFKFHAFTLRLLGFVIKRHKRISPRRLAYLLAQIFGEPKQV